MSDREEYYIYYDDDKTENIPVIKHIVPLQPNENQIVVHNTTNYDNNLYDTSFILMSIFLHFIAVVFVFELGKTCYRSINRNNNNRNNNRNNERLVIRPNPNYYHNKVIVIEEISDELCSICLEPLYDKEDLENNKPVISLKCNHMFHKECLDPWVINHKCCPLCKRNT
tara:strand:+ start:9440 stop:9946 length:507 start_codon:yes stop_codon:yes gene_type:complete